MYLDVFAEENNYTCDFGIFHTSVNRISQKLKVSINGYWIILGGNQIYDDATKSGGLRFIGSPEKEQGKGFETFLYFSLKQRDKEEGKTQKFNLALR